jgi:hypothetical protein
MKACKLLIFLLFSIVNVAFARSANWFERRMNDLDSAIKINSVPERIDELGKFMSIGSHGGMDAEQKLVFIKAQATLLAIPGHAKFYQDQIETTRKLAIEHKKLSQEERLRLRKEGTIRDPGDYRDMRVGAFEILKLLPSSETVAVLGHFLNDQESRDGNDMFGKRIEFTDVLPYPPNCAAAYLAIIELGIKSPPTPAPKTRIPGDWNLDNVDAWKGWWNEIKTGKRTYRFIGSDIEYGPDGPATPEQIEKARVTRERDEKRATGHGRQEGKEAVGGKEPETTRSSSLFMLISAAAAALASIVWYLRRKNAAV